jgi:hypothetical protein
MLQEQQKKRSGPFKLLASEILLGTLITVLSVMVAWAAYLGALADSAESDANVEGQKILSLSNTEFLRANQDIMQDYTMYDGYFVNQDSQPDIADYYEANFSDGLIDSLDRPDGPFDDAYYDAMYADADGSYDEAVAKFDEAQQAGNKANNYQLTVLIFAVGLALSAWASVVREESMMRPMFAVIALVSLGYGLITFLSLYSSP